MAHTIGVRELKNQASKILRDVREIGVEYIVTLDGQPVAVIRPYTEEDSKRRRQEIMEKEMAQLLALAEQIGREWQSPQSGVEILEEMRDSRNERD